MELTREESSLALDALAKLRAGQHDAARIEAIGALAMKLFKRMVDIGGAGMPTAPASGEDEKC